MSKVRIDLLAIGLLFLGLVLLGLAYVLKPDIVLALQVALLICTMVLLE
jgi:hypothetical protein